MAMGSFSNSYKKKLQKESYRILQFENKEKQRHLKIWIAWSSGEDQEDSPGTSNNFKSNFQFSIYLMKFHHVDASLENLGNKKLHRLLIFYDANILKTSQHLLPPTRETFYKARLGLPPKPIISLTLKNIFSTFSSSAQNQPDIYRASFVE